MPKKKSSKKSAAKASKRSKAWAKRVATKYETPKKIGHTRIGAVGKKRTVAKTGGSKHGPGVVIEAPEDDTEAIEDGADD